MVSSYVDDTTILVAADTQVQACYEGCRLFTQLSETSGLRGLGFSVLKTERIGLGDTAWKPLSLGDVSLAPVEEMRVLGYRIN